MTLAAMLDLLRKWTDDEQLVTDGRHVGRVIGYKHDNLGTAEAQIRVLTGGVAWSPLMLLRPLGMKPAGDAQ